MAVRKKKTTVGSELPFRQLDQFWNWLPAFRAVAETGGINEAARQLRLSPSALSRSVGCLEVALGEPLFRREGGFTLTAAGQRLLTATRDAMRGVHDATRADAPLAGPIPIATTSRIGLYRLLPALRRLRALYPSAEPLIRSVSMDEVAPLLHRGEIDLAIVMEIATPPSLQSSPLAPAPCHVYCGQDHPLFSVRSPSEETVATHAFAAPTASAVASVSTDAWPPALPRVVAMRSDTIEPAVDACVRGELLTCLPDEIVEALGLASRLRALPNPRLPSTPLLCLRRRPIGTRTTFASELARLLEGRAPGERSK